MRAGLIGMAVILLSTSAATEQRHSAVVDLPVRVFDRSGQSDDGRTLALETAAAVLATAGVRVTWTVCSGGTSAIGCSEALKETERVVGLMPTSPSWSRQEGASMGHSVVDGRTRSGVLATIYADRVDWMASRAA